MGSRTSPGKSLRTRAFVDLNGSTSQIDNPALVIIDRRESNDNNAYAAFGQVDYSFTDQWIVTAGARFDRDEREQTDVGSGAVQFAIGVQGLAPCARAV